MKLRTKIAALVLAAGLAAAGLTACASDAATVSKNLSTEAEQFRIERTIVFYNGITNTYIATVKGRCSVDQAENLESGTLAVTCKIGDDQYIKDFLGPSDNVTWFSLQEKPVDVSVYHYEVLFKPEAVIPDLRVETGQQ
ncbi:hypothetical protein B7R22_17070 [Subtercola boreus]|uniref:Lipoprotein n=1 Tax=Subtercola boreus TaxID=120213 RepID=A0A3E0VQ80_9MICO|nr:hypothetical protein [Subtercola boreus]RFA12142.1 hypothetical protein B7R22_17070 [Subtercola boreus]